MTKFYINEVFIFLFFIKAIKFFKRKNIELNINKIFWKK